MHSRSFTPRLDQKLCRLACLVLRQSTALCRPCPAPVSSLLLPRWVHSSPPWPNTRPVTAVSDLSVSNQQGPVSTTEELQRSLEHRERILLHDIMSRKVNKQAVFTNSDISLKYINVYGFDFDYTLVHYTTEVHRLIYNSARDRLVEKLNYPTAIKTIPFNAEFAIRGLHCDINNGFLMKIDAYNHIQVGSVYRGHSRVSLDEILERYGGTHVPMHVTDSLPTSIEVGQWKLTQYLDLFSIPEATLFADVTEYLLRKNIEFDPEYLFEDVQKTVQEVHQLGLIHTTISSDLGRYVHTNRRLPEFLNRLKSKNKRLFLITNSPYWFVNKGMCHATQSNDWRDLFDVIIVGARKPSFYSEAGPFRSLNSDSDSMTPTWWRVTSLEPGQVYQQGNVNDFIRMTGWKGSSVLYFGDHVFSDLADPIMQHGWKTGAIIPELETEIQVAGSEEFKNCLTKLLVLESLLKEHQAYGYSDPDLVQMLDQWRRERGQAKRSLKESHNTRFGSVFRTEKSPTYFSRRLATFANLYMSSLDNLMNYSLDYTFIPRRSALPHELDLNFDL